MTVELAVPSPARPRTLRASPARDGPRLAAWILGFAPVLYLALRGGGYDLVVRSEVGLVTWWIVLLGALIGVLPLQRIGALGWVAIGLLGGFALWTGIAAGWSESAEKTIAELGRLTTYLGFLVLGLCVVRRDTLRPLVTGIGVAFGVVTVLAALSRLAPSLFPSNQVAVFFPGSQVRLSYPLNYANGTGEFLAIGIPLLLMIATGGRTLAGRALGAAAIPAAVLAIVLTASRGGVLAAIVAVLAFYVLAPDRLPKLATGLVAAAGSAILVGELLQRAAVRNALTTPLAVSQRHQLTVLLLIVCAGVAAAQVGIDLAARRIERPGALTIRRRRAGWLTLGGIAIALIVVVAAGLPSELSHQWRVFKQTDVTHEVSGNLYSRLGTAAGSHRYQYWAAAVHAFESQPLNGIGPGTFQFYWAQHGSLFEFIRNAHSLYLESLAEVGVVGFALITGLLLALLVAGVARTLRAPATMRLALAAASASLIAFCAAAAYDWVWQLAVIALVALLLGAAILSCGPEQESPGPTGGNTWVPRGVLAALAIGATIAIGIPLGATASIRSSQADVRAGHLQLALTDAATAQRLEPYAATPRLQRALILERAGDLRDARAAIAQATSREPTNSSIWLVRARIDAESGREVAATRDYRRAHALNPLSPTTSLGS
jgi:O-Antigen ligase/Tetratricopeptide repeat